MLVLVKCYEIKMVLLPFYLFFTSLYLKMILISYLFQQKEDQEWDGFFLEPFFFKTFFFCQSLRQKERKELLISMKNKLAKNFSWQITQRSIIKLFFLLLKFVVASGFFRFFCSNLLLLPGFFPVTTSQNENPGF